MSDDVALEKQLGQFVSALRLELVANIEKALEGTELTAAQYRVVVVLAHNERLTMAHLCETLEYDRGAMSRLIHRLESKGLINKEPCVKDKRLVYLTLTEQGKVIFPELQPRVEGVYRRALSEFSEQEKRQFGRFLAKSLNSLK